MKIKGDILIIETTTLHIFWYKYLNYSTNILILCHRFRGMLVLNKIIYISSIDISRFIP